MSPSGQWEVPGGDQNEGGEILGYYSLPLTLFTVILSMNLSPKLQLPLGSPSTSSQPGSGHRVVILGQDFKNKLVWTDSKEGKCTGRQTKNGSKVLELWTNTNVQGTVRRPSWPKWGIGHKLGGIETIVLDGLNGWRNVDGLWWMLEAAGISWWRDYFVQTSSVVTTGWLSWLLASFWLGNDNNHSGWKRRWFMCILTPLQI